MDSTKVMSLLEALDDEIDDLEESLEPLVKVALSETASKLPLLDKAKLYVLVTYAIESMLFSYLRLHGVKARDHPVFQELTRVKQYFDKIKNIESPPERTVSVDKAAAARFIKAGLAGNDKYDLVRAEMIAKEKAKAHIRFNEVEKKRRAGELKTSADEDSSSDSDSAPESSEAVATVSKKRQKLDADGSKASSGAETPSKEERMKRTKQERKERKAETKTRREAKLKVKRAKKEKKLAEKIEKATKGEA